MKYSNGLRCPACGGDWIIRVHRRLLGKLLRPHKSKYLCDSCKTVFFARRPRAPEEAQSKAG